jgi:hypothetical protein
LTLPISHPAKRAKNETAGRQAGTKKGPSYGMEFFMSEERHYEAGELKIESGLSYVRTEKAVKCIWALKILKHRKRFYLN